MKLSELKEINESELPRDGNNFIALWEYNDLIWTVTYRIVGNHWEVLCDEGTWVDASGEWDDLDISYYTKKVK